MSVLGLIDPGHYPPKPTTTAPAELDLCFEEVLASASRLWVRGRLHLAPSIPPRTVWWKRWRKQSSVVQPAVAHLETRIGGEVLETDVTLTADGWFESLSSCPMPTTRRGWRLARNKLTYQGQSVEKCAVVLLPPEDTRQTVLVILPREYTLVGQGLQTLAKSDFAPLLPPLLRRLSQGCRAIYYLAAVSPDGSTPESELALITTTLGWPQGPFILLPASSAEADRRLLEGLDHFRWLFAGSMTVQVLNLDTELTISLPAALDAKEDRAVTVPVPFPGHASGTSARPIISAIPARLRPTRANRLPVHPVVFCHGMLATSAMWSCLPDNLNYFFPLKDFLANWGYRVLYPQVPPTSGIVERAERLREQILRWTDEPVNLICHSMGGLDARYMITHLGMADRVRSLTTVSTPHRGTYLAEWFLRNYRNRVPLLLALEALGMSLEGFRDCRPSACVDFNARTPDMPGVKYFSYGGEVPVSRLSPMLRRAWSLLYAVEGPNDGMVSLASARWGDYLGTVHADHYAQTPDMVFVRPKETFDPLEFYLRILDELARRGF